MNYLRATPWVLRMVKQQGWQREMTSLADDLTVYLSPTPVWSTRTWRCLIRRAGIDVADTSGHETPLDAFRQARAMLERREGRDVA